jgi:hypothetical protein
MLMTALFSHHDPDFISQKLGKALESCSDWLVDNKLSLHLGKTECMIFGPKKKLKKLISSILFVMVTLLNQLRQLDILV